MSTTLTIGGSSVSIPGVLIPVKTSLYSREGVPWLTLQNRGVTLAALPDPYLGAEAVLRISGSVVFRGDVVSLHPTYNDQLGYVFEYQCLGLRFRGDRVPFTDDVTGIDTAVFNCQFDLNPQEYIASRAGRTVGEILTDVLQMLGNANNLDSKGIGNYTGLPTTPTLPTNTVNDLAAAAMAFIPPGPVYVTGEKLLGAIESFLAQWAPNHCLWIDPDSTELRFLDLRTFTNHTFTQGTDPIDPGELSREWGDCFPRVVLRGQPLVLGILASLSNGLLAENFTWNGYATNAAAKAAWTDADFKQSQTSQDSGTCTCPSTTTVTVTSADAALTWAANFWDQTSTGRHGWVNLKYAAGTGITQYYNSPIVSNTSLSAGGTSTLTLGYTLPITNYDSYQIFGYAGGESGVWRNYSVTNAAIAAKLANQFTKEQPFVTASGNAATLTSFPMGSVLFSASGSPPYNETSLAFDSDPVSGTILFRRPTWEVAGNQAPADVRALLAVNVAVNQAIYPPDSGGLPVYGGTSYSVEGIEDTLTVTIDSWRDPANQTAMNAYALELWSSVSNTIVEGTLIYKGLFTNALTMGLAVSITGNGYTTGWEGLALPVLECELEWAMGKGLNYVMTFHCSNRRAALTAAGFMRPDRVGLDTFGLGDNNPFEGHMGGIASTVGADLGMGAANAMVGGAMGAGAAPMSAGMDTGMSQMQGGMDTASGQMGAGMDTANAAAGGAFGGTDTGLGDQATSAAMGQFGMSTDPMTNILGGGGEAGGFGGVVGQQQQDEMPVVKPPAAEPPGPNEAAAPEADMGGMDALGVGGMD